MSHGMTTPSQAFLSIETSLGSPHGMPLTPAFGPDGPCWVSLNNERNNTPKYVLGSMLAMSQTGTQISENLQCANTVHSSLPNRTLCDDGDGVCMPFDPVAMSHMWLLSP